jgi:DNA adenine methylase
MQYLGGKSRVLRWLVPELRKRWRGEGYFEPFVGAGWVIAESAAPVRFGNDINSPLICLLEAVANGWQPPVTLTEDEYNALRGAALSPLKAFAGFGCSWGGKWFGGYARSGTRNYALNARNSLLKMAPKLAGVQWHARDYRDAKPGGFFIYADPPYEGATAYDFSRGFDHNAFWETMRVWSASNTVLISEYAAPSDFRCIAQTSRLQDMRFVDSTRHTVTEKLFVHESLRME